MTQPNDVLAFWFGADPVLWFSKNDAFDAAIRSHFGVTLEDARQGKHDDWCETLDGMLALIIVLDQFSRNLYRGLPLAYAQDAKAFELAHALEAHPDFGSLTPHQQQFGVMPMMHAEDLDAQKACLAHMERIGIEGAIDAAREHLDIIERFGRFPHRNAVLGRKTTDEEAAFLQAGGFAG